MNISEADYIAHYGTLHKSGRYPWGSGGEPVSSRDFLGIVEGLRKQGLSQVEIARGLGISTTDLRARKSIAKNEKKQDDIATAQRLRDKGMSPTAIGRQMGRNESVIRSYLADGVKEKADALNSIADRLRADVDEKRYIDIGSGVEAHMNITPSKLKVAVAMLKEEGYRVHYLKVPQLGTTHDTSRIVLCSPDVTYSELYKNRANVSLISATSDDGGRTFKGVRIQPPLSINPDRVSVRYAEEGGSKTDGVIYVRPGVPDLSLGSSHYSQVRIAVGDGHYLKGMAMHKDGLPDGVDLVFNTSKSDTGNKFDAMKPVTGDVDNPFGSVIRQITEKDAEGKDHVVSAMNIVHEEGNWADWSKTVSSQMLSKQSPHLAKGQLDMTFASKQKEFDEIANLTNPTVRKKLLQEFSDSVDSSAVHLDAAGFPRQGWHVILPFDSMPPGQVYAPNFKDGERVVLVRFPHAGTFEIPELVVNNKHPEARRVLGTSPRDAIGIHHSVAERLSGADFDGDTVLVIPNNSNKVLSTPALEGLRNFEPRIQYKAYPGMPKIKNMQAEMGKVSNLITDMTIRGAPVTDIVHAVKHSMVVIDSEKHDLNHKQSAIDNGILSLKKKYQVHPDSTGLGASTLISRAKARAYVPDRKPRKAADGGPIDLATGRKMYEDTGKLHYKTGKPIQIKSRALAETDDAFTLSSGTRMETLYASHSNKLKKMANEARLIMVNTPRLKYSPSAKETYTKEVESLNSALIVAIRNRPLERQAQAVAGAIFQAKRDANPNMDDETIKKEKFKALEDARIRVGAEKHRIKISQTEWDAIQAGAISDNKLQEILDNADMKTVRQLATPRQVVLMTPNVTNRAKSMLASGYTRAEVAAQLGVSLTTLDVGVKETTSEGN